jgi:hypothetical protein
MSPGAEERRQGGVSVADRTASQFQDEHKGRGWFFLLSWVGAGITLGIGQREFIEWQDNLAIANTPEQITLATKKVQDAEDFRNIMIGVELGVIGVSMIEAVMSVPKPMGAIVLGTRLRAPSDGTSPVGVEMTLAQVKF